MCEANEFLPYFSFRVRKELEKKLPKIQVEEPLDIAVKNNVPSQHYIQTHNIQKQPVIKQSNISINQHPLQSFNSNKTTNLAKRIKLVDYDEPVSFSIKSKQVQLTKPDMNHQTQKSVQNIANHQQIQIQSEKVTEPEPVVKSKDMI